MSVQKRFRRWLTEPASFRVLQAESTATAMAVLATSGYSRWAERVRRYRRSQSTIRSAERVTFSTLKPESRTDRTFQLKTGRIPGLLRLRRLLLRAYRRMEMLPRKLLR